MYTIDGNKGCKGPRPNIPQIGWSNLVEQLMLGPDMLKELELTMKRVQGNLKTTQDR